MDKNAKEALKAKIVELIKKMELDIAETEKMVQPISPENSLGRVSRMDAINNKGVMDASLRSKKTKLFKLKIALENVDKEGFGSCNNCKQNIQEARMMFMPESTLCVRCASR